MTISLSPRHQYAIISSTYCASSIQISFVPCAPLADAHCLSAIRHGSHPDSGLLRWKLLTHARYETSTMAIGYKNASVYRDTGNCSSGIMQHSTIRDVPVPFMATEYSSHPTSERDPCMYKVHSMTALL
jgi:hypothetical protein